jgi:tetratricopeptide (TPR) repeat protein
MKFHGLLGVKIKVLIDKSAIFGAVCIIGCMHVVYAFPQQDKKRERASLDELISLTLAETYNFKFGDALKVTDEIIRKYPDEPVGYLYKCGVYWKMVEQGCAEPEDSINEEIGRLIDKACECSKHDIEAHRNEVMARFCYAGALVYRARREAIDHEWFSVLSDGSKVKELLEEAIAMKPDFYDAYSGIGAFNYYGARIPWYLKPLAFVMGISGDEEEGISQLEKAAKLGKYSQVEAAVFLASVVYKSNGNFVGSSRVMSELHLRYPDNLDFVENLCYDYYELQNYSKVIDLANAVLKDGTVNKCYKHTLASIRFYRAESYERLNQIDKAVDDYEFVIRNGGNSYSYRKAMAALERLKRR